ncbi:hypothetical protein ACLB2K_062666 [Fragaria x ananassa]
MELVDRRPDYLAMVKDRQCHIGRSSVQARQGGIVIRNMCNVSHIESDGFVIENVHNTHLVAGNISMNVSACHANEVDEDEDEDEDDIDDSSVEEIY